MVVKNCLSVLIKIFFTFSPKGEYGNINIHYQKHFPSIFDALKSIKIPFKINICVDKLWKKQRKSIIIINFPPIKSTRVNKQNFFRLFSIHTNYGDQ